MSSVNRVDGLFHQRTARRVIGALASLALAGGLAASPVATAAAARAAHAIRHVVDDVTVGGFVAALAPVHVEDLLAGAPNLAGTGLRLGDLRADEQSTALGLVRSLVSVEASAHLSALLHADAVLDTAAGGGSEWSAAEYRLALFGDPEGDHVLQFSTSQLLLTAMRQGDEADVRLDLVA